MKRIDIDSAIKSHTNGVAVSTLLPAAYARTCRFQHTVAACLDHPEQAEGIDKESATYRAIDHRVIAYRLGQ
ncbi:MAG: hypothetical protein IPP59_13435 [Betaproteobacteria bacterium]|nr:hypothetical protein [Candidatus Dechloromonas phosphorivorans]